MTSTHSCILFAPHLKIEHGEEFWINTECLPGRKVSIIIRQDWLTGLNFFGFVRGSFVQVQQTGVKKTTFVAIRLGDINQPTRTPLTANEVVAPSQPETLAINLADCPLLRRKSEEIQRYDVGGPRKGEDRRGFEDRLRDSKCFVY